METYSRQDENDFDNYHSAILQRISDKPILCLLYKAHAGVEYCVEADNTFHTDQICKHDNALVSYGR